jgi:hypothetical protein
MTKFHIRVDGGPEQTITVKTGVYRDAVAAIPALLNLDLPITVEIWVPHLLPEYGPSHYLVRQNVYGELVTKFLPKPGGDPLRNNPVVGFMSEAQAESILDEMRNERS